MFHSKAQVGSFWQVDLGDAWASLDSITIHNRKETYARANLDNATLKVLDADNNVLHTASLSEANKQTIYPFSNSVRLHQLLKKKSPVSLDLRYLRIEAPGEWMNFSQVTAKDRRGNNLSRGKPLSDGAYSNSKATHARLLDGHERVRSYTGGPLASHRSARRTAISTVSPKLPLGGRPRGRRQRRRHHHHTQPRCGQSLLVRATMTFLDDSGTLWPPKPSGANEQTFTAPSLTRVALPGPFPTTKAPTAASFRWT